MIVRVARNLNAPKFQGSKFSASLKRSAAVKSQVISVRATDADKKVRGE